MRRLAYLGLTVASILAIAHCAADNGEPGSPAPPTNTATAPTATSPIEELPIQESLRAAGLSGPVDVVRDTAGTPHIYAETLPDAAWVQGYQMAQDRWVQMDFARRQASGTLSEIVGGLSAGALQSDLVYRMHGLRRTAEAHFAKLNAAGADEVDHLLVRVLTNFAAGVNAWQADLRAGKYKLPSLDPYGVEAVTLWSEIDSLVLAELQAFSLAFDADSEILHSLALEKEQAAFVGAADPTKAARAGFVDDFYRLKAFDPTYTVDGWKSATSAPAEIVPGPTPLPAGRAGARPDLVKLYEGALAAIRGAGLARTDDPDRGSNNWVVGPRLSANGHAMVANDTHLALNNPAIFYLVHISTKDGFDAMGAQFAGIPLITLGMNRHVAWGATVSYIDVTDVYREHVEGCAADAPGKCVIFNGAKVPLTERKETFKIGLKGEVTSSVDVTYYEVPHHGPILVRPSGHGIEPLGASELSIRYTGYEPGSLLRAVYGVATAKSSDEAVTAVDTYFTHGGQNWVFADDAGNIAWTQAERIPRRPKGIKPWMVLAGDGTAEWNGYFDPKLAPHARNPDKGFLVTANADPIGVTDDNDPTNDREVDGFPFYLGAEYDPGTRIGRITQRIQEAAAAGKKLDRDVMSSIQADAMSRWGRALSPTFVAAAQALIEEAQTPGTHPELSAMLTSASAEVRALVPDALAAVSGWSFDTPAAMPEDSPTPAELADSRATAIMAAWTTRFAQATVGDELAALGLTADRRHTLKMLSTLLAHPEDLKTGAVLFDDLTTPAVETKLMVAAASVLRALDWLRSDKGLGADTSAWRWGTIHYTEPSFALGAKQRRMPRHGGDGTVDVGAHGLEDDDYSFRSGAAIRFVAELDPQRGPIARNVLPGGEIFDPASPHYGDMFELWAKNQAFELPFRVEEVAAQSNDELAKNKIGRRRFTP